MKAKFFLKVLLGLAVALIGYLQLQNNTPEPQAKHTRSGGAGQGQAKPQGQADPHGALQRASNTVGDYDYYVVSYSWSPTYCLTHPNDERQCGGRGFGFVLHGLWPQKSAGGWPENCKGENLSQSVIERALPFMPSEKLIRHEWYKHGTCSGLSAQAYFELADKAFASLRIPVDLQAPSATLLKSPEKIRSDFLAANPSLPSDSLTLRCSGNQLDEVRLCVDTQLKPQSCGKGVRNQCSRETVEVRAVR